MQTIVEKYDKRTEKRKETKKTNVKMTKYNEKIEYYK